MLVGRPRRASGTQDQSPKLPLLSLPSLLHIKLFIPLGTSGNHYYQFSSQKPETSTPRLLSMATTTSLAPHTPTGAGFQNPNFPNPHGPHDARVIIYGWVVNQKPP